MIKWSKFGKQQLKADEKVEFSDSDIEQVKTVIGLSRNDSPDNFRFSGSIYGILSECFLAASFKYEEGFVKKVLRESNAENATIAFKNSVYSEDLLNLFDCEDSKEPNFDMLVSFLKRQMETFQSLPVNLQSCWVGQWSDINGFAFFWVSGNYFHLIAKMSS
jgi:hypothetical protein